MSVEIIGCGTNRMIDMTWCDWCEESPETDGCTERRKWLGVPFILNWNKDEQSPHTDEDKTNLTPMSVKNWIICDKVPHAYVCPVCKEEFLRKEPFFQYKLYACPQCGNLISIGEDGILK